MSSDLPIIKRCCQPNSRYLPRDLLESIFSKADLQSVVHCQQLSREWRSFLFSSRFAIQWCKKNKGVFGWYASIMRPHNLDMFIPYDQTQNMPCLALDFLPEKCNLYATSMQGLVVCASSGGWKAVRYYICRPISHEWIMLPNPRWRYEVKRMALAVSPDPPYRYKIVRLFDRGPDASNYGCEMLDSNIWRWVLYNIKLKRDHVIAPEPPVLYKSSFHWMIDGGRFVFAFSILNGSSRKINLPNHLASNEEDDVDRLTIGTIEGRLFCLHLLPTAIDLWFLRKYEQPEWEHSHRIVLTYGMCIPSASIVSFLYSDLACVATQEGCMWLRVLKDWSAQILGGCVLVIESDSDTRGPDFIYPFFTDDGPSNMTWRSNCRSSRNPTWSMRSKGGGERCKKLINITMKMIASANSETTNQPDTGIRIICSLTLSERAAAVPLNFSLDDDYFSRHSGW